MLYGPFYQTKIVTHLKSLSNRNPQIVVEVSGPRCMAVGPSRRQLKAVIFILKDLRPGTSKRQTIKYPAINFPTAFPGEDHCDQ